MKKSKSQESEEHLWYEVAENLTELGKRNQHGVKWKVVPREDCDYYDLYKEYDK